MSEDLRQLAGYLYGLGADAEAFDKQIAQTETTTTKLVGVGDNAEIIEYPRPVPDRSHSFSTLEGFISFLASDHVKTENGIVFVSDDAVTADIAYGKHKTDTATLSLERSAELSELACFFEPSMQRELWLSLIGELDGCFDESLFLSIAQLKMTKTNEAQATIQESGVVESGGSARIHVGYGEKQTDIPVLWEWSGRAFECWDEGFNLECRLEVDAREGLTFRFHPRRFGRFMDEARAKLVKELTSRLTNQFTVHEGTL